MKKRSVKIEGHATSVSLEEEFWAVLHNLAREEDLSVAALIAQIDEARGIGNLSSALRLYVLAALQQKITDLQAPSE